MNSMRRVNFTNSICCVHTITNSLCHINLHNTLSSWYYVHDKLSSWNVHDVLSSGCVRYRSVVVILKIQVTSTFCIFCLFSVMNLSVFYKFACMSMSLGTCVASTSLSCRFAWQSEFEMLCRLLHVLHLHWCHIDLHEQWVRDIMSLVACVASMLMKLVTCDALKSWYLYDTLSSWNIFDSLSWPRVANMYTSTYLYIYIHTCVFAYIYT